MGQASRLRNSPLAAGQGDGNFKGKGDGNDEDTQGIASASNALERFKARRSTYLEVHFGHYCGELG